jgi:hypothetical protein
MFCCFMFNGGVFASVRVDFFVDAPLTKAGSLVFDLSTLTVKAGKIAPTQGDFADVSKPAFDHYVGAQDKAKLQKIVIGSKGFTSIFHELVDIGHDVCLEGLRKMSIGSKFSQLFSRSQKAGYILTCAVVIPLAVYGAYNLIPVLVKKYRAAAKRYHEKYAQDEE